MTEGRDGSAPNGGRGRNGRLPFAAVDRLSSGLNSIGTVAIFGLMVLINWDIFGRAFFATPLKGVPEIVSLSIVCIVFLQIAHSLLRGSFTRSDALFNKLLQRYPPVGYVVQAVYHVAGAFLFALIFRATWPKFLGAWSGGEYLGTEGYFAAPVWPVRFLILVGCAAAVLQLLVLAWRDLRSARSRQASP